MDPPVRRLEGALGSTQGTKLVGKRTHLPVRARRAARLLSTSLIRLRRNLLSRHWRWATRSEARVARENDVLRDGASYSYAAISGIIAGASRGADRERTELKYLVSVLPLLARLRYWPEEAMGYARVQETVTPGLTCGTADGELLMVVPELEDIGASREKDLPDLRNNILLLLLLLLFLLPGGGGTPKDATRTQSSNRKGQKDAIYWLAPLEFVS
ncbi:hypothetical protein FB451DRAFT_1177766 [Mycena latifolia]|nr:hypothetical protein FB451DRAFT_1177766 [Mycena latifolia]